jgi:hypothetical protein
MLEASVGGTVPFKGQVSMNARTYVASASSSKVTGRGLGIQKPI